MVVRRAERVVRHVPSWTEDQKVRQWMMWCLGLGCQHAEDRRIDVVLGYAPDIHELLQCILIWYVAEMLLKWQ